MLTISSKEIKEKSLLLIRLDAIGDYILFRNFINELKQSNKYKEYNITLLGNIAWKSISEEFDNELIEEFIWIDRTKFSKNFIYRYKKLKEITSFGYELVISPAYSREFFYADNIVKHVTSKERIGNSGDLSNIKKWQKDISDNYYTKLIYSQNIIKFEFFRNKEFFEKLIDKKLDNIVPKISLLSKKLNLKLPNKYAIIFIGASDSYRKWGISSFAKVAKYLKCKYGYKIILCGAPYDSEGAIEFSKYFKDNYIDLVGKTSLIDLLYIIDNGSLIISNETSAPHFAVALGKINIFVISNGNHYGRFSPYPKDLTLNYHVIYHPSIEKDLNNYDKLSSKYGYGSNLDINDISFETVIKKMNYIIK